MKQFEGGFSELVNQTIKDLKKLYATGDELNAVSLSFISMELAVITDIMVDEHNQKVEEERHERSGT